MSNINSITAVHIGKLDHNLDEIRLRALNNIISKLDDGFSYNSKRTERDFIFKLFDWFTSKSLPCLPEQLLNLIFKLIKKNQVNIQNVGISELKKKLAILKTILDTSWHSKINEIETAAANQITPVHQFESNSTPESLKFLQHNVQNAALPEDNFNLNAHINDCNNRQNNNNCDHQEEINDYHDKTTRVDGAGQFDETIDQLNFTFPGSGHNTISNNSETGNSTAASSTLKKEGAIRWLLFPWQPLVSSDYGVLSAVEEALNTSVKTNANVIIRTCQFITNVMLQDFPAEVFLQRPSIVMILQSLLQQTYASQEHRQTKEAFVLVTPMVLRTLQKLTRSLRFRIHYYCDASVVNGRQRDVGKKNANSSSLSYSIDQKGDGDAEDAVKHNDDLIPTMNYHAASYPQSTGDAVAPASDSIVIDDEWASQMQQMLIPNYCTETLNHLFKLILSVPIGDYLSRPLKDMKNMIDLMWELLQLLIVSITPSIWMCSDEVSLKIHEDLKLVMEIAGDVLQHLLNYHTLDYVRISYLHIVCMTLKLLCSLVPLELADLIIPNSLKISTCIALMDPPIFIMYPEVNAILQEYARRFRGSTEMEYVKLFDETRLIAKSMNAAIALLKSSMISPREMHSDMLKLMYASKLCLTYHRNLSIISKYIYFMQNLYRIKLNKDDSVFVNKLMLYLLANGDNHVRAVVYKECHALVSATMLGDGIHEIHELHDKQLTYSSTAMSANRLLFLCNSNVLTEIICHGINDDDAEIKRLSEDILIYLLKGKIQMQDKMWLKFIESLLPILSLLQCHADMKTSLGQSVAKIFDPDISVDIQLPSEDVLKGNIRFLYSLDSAIRDEAVYRLIYLLGIEKNVSDKLPRLVSLHGLPLASLIFNHIEKNRQVIISHKFDGKYPTSGLLSVLEMFKITNVEPKIRKSALVQLSVMLTDSSLHRVFLSEAGLEFIFDIFEKALTERDYEYYPDLVISIITILKLIVLSQSTVRHELSSRSDILINILRSIFLFPNNQCIKSDASILLFLLVFNDQIILINNNKLRERMPDQPSMEISLPQIILNKVRCPIVCKSHWRYSINRKSDTSLIHFSNPMALTFLRQFWAWEWNNYEGNSLLNMNEKCINNSEITEKLMIHKSEVAYLKYSSVGACCHQQLLNIQNSTSHYQVTCALDYLWMYIKYNALIEQFMRTDKLTSMPWEKTFQRFLLSNPTNKDDGHLYIDILNFLNIFINITHDQSVIMWLSKIIKTIAKSLTDTIENFDLENQDIHQSILRLVRSLRRYDFNSGKLIDELQENNLQLNNNNNNNNNMWNLLIQLLISNLCFNDQQQHREHQQHFYNLVYLDWLLTCLISLTSRCQWDCPRDLLVSLGNALIELITSFHGNGAVSFMGLSITRNSIICLNHFVHYMRLNLQKPNDWTSYWYKQEGRTLSWITILWKNRDPLIRASALQLLGGLLNAPHNSQQLLGALAVSPSELCQSLIQFIVNHEECCIVKEHACIALSNLIINSGNQACGYNDTLGTHDILIYIEQMNIYYEINLLCCNIYMPSSIDPNEAVKLSLSFNYDVTSNIDCNELEKIELMKYQHPLSLPKAILHFYNCHDELLILSASSSVSAASSSAKNMTISNLFPQFISTPSLIRAICTMLNNLIIVGEHESISRVYEHSLDKYFVRCLGPVPKYSGKLENNLNQHCDILELYTSICVFLTNCIVQNENFSSAVNFSPDILCVILNYLDNNQFDNSHNSDSSRKKFANLRDKLWTSVFNFLSALSLTEQQNSESLYTAIELVGMNIIVKGICDAINQNEEIELRISGVAFFAFLLSQEIVRLENDADEADDDDSNEETKKTANECSSLGKILDTTEMSTIKNKPDTDDDDSVSEKNELQVTIGSQICKALIRLLIAHNYANKSCNNAKRTRDKNVIIGALSNLLSISNEAKKLAIDENLGTACIFILKELYAELNLQPYNNIQRLNAGRDKKVIPSLLSDINRVMILLMNFAYNSKTVKSALSQLGLADMLHKLWAWISLNDSTLLTSLKLMATFTTNCPEGAQSLTLTTTLWPGIGLRKTPNTVSLIHVIIQMITKEIDKTESQLFNIPRLNLAFNVLRNAVHVYECRVSIAKSNLLELFIKIHPSSTKRTKPWLLVEVYCLEFLIDFTFYDEGQISVSKATDALEVLIQLAGCNTAATRILALSTLRNLLFNTSNRPRLICSVEFINLLHRTFKNGNLCEIGIAGSMLWSLVANNQKGKLIARTSGLSSSLQEVLGRLTLMPDEKKQDVANMLQYVIKLLSTDT